MRATKFLALLIMMAVMFTTTGVLAIDYSVPEGASTMTAQFGVIDTARGNGFSMISEDGSLVINISDSTLVYFEDFSPAREALQPGQTLADLLNGRNLTVTYGVVTRSIPPQTSPISVRILFEQAVTLPIDIGDGYQDVVTLPGFIGNENGYQGIVTLPWFIGDGNGYQDVVTIPGFIGNEDGYQGIVTLPWFVGDGNGYQDVVTLPGYVGNVSPGIAAPIYEFSIDELNGMLNGEIVVNGVIIESQSPYWVEGENGNVLMVPLRCVAEALGYDVTWNESLRSVQIGVANNIWIGSTEAHRGRMAPIELSAAPVIVDNSTFVPIDFFRSVLAQSAYAFEGQVVVESLSDMF